MAIQTKKQVADMLDKEAHQVYLDTWEIMTQVAENDGVYTNEHQHLQTKAIQDLASTIELLAGLVEMMADDSDY